VKKGDKMFNFGKWYTSKKDYFGKFYTIKKRVFLKGYIWTPFCKISFHKYPE